MGVKAEGEGGGSKSHLADSFHFERHLYTQCTESTHHGGKGDALSTLSTADL